MAAVKVKNETGETKWGYVNGTGEMVIKPEFDDAEAFSEGLALVKKGTVFGYINTKGEFVFAPQFEMAASFKENMAMVKKNGGFGFIANPLK